MAPTNETQTAVATVVKDSFFDDPFFSDWWKDFDAPMMQTYDTTFQRQISGTIQFKAFYNRSDFNAIIFWFNRNTAKVVVGLVLRSEVGQIDGFRDNLVDEATGLHDLQGRQVRHRDRYRRL